MPRGGALGAVDGLLDRLREQGVECHSLMVVHRGKVAAEGWWAPYSAERVHLLYSLTKSFTSIAVGIAIGDGLLSLEDRLVDVLPEHVPADVSEQGRRITVHHLLSMTVGHEEDSLEEAWRLEPADLVKGFLRVPFVHPEGTRHVYDNATTFILARMVERVTGQDLPEYLDERLFTPMGIEDAEWDRVASGAAFGFHGLHLTTEAIAAFGELLLRGGRWGDQQLVPREWVELATTKYVDTLPLPNWTENQDFQSGYGYQFWISRHGYFGHGSYGQYCVVVPSHELVVAITGAIGPEAVLPGLIWDCLLPALDSGGADDALADRLRNLSLATIEGTAGRSAEAKIDDTSEVLPSGTTVTLDAVDGGWTLRLGPLTVDVGHRAWRESSPLGRPIVAMGGWQGDTYVADVYVITTPHRVRLTITGGTATATWNVIPLTGPDLLKHVRAPLMTRPDVS
ncbi:CubicO group peptidase (beta-lactamase class C family) [Kribbella jejuensis]|uniref:CubicO group peptidase (Beta-lactamase class C family) n=1 Tax=Kribbella jejuensis TaxID=236068 RepID=A0A542EV69_9ACTN|nr:CubicO group peptidase (beta-lactamase class C family) [Kribbella jejuensis]